MPHAIRIHKTGDSEVLRWEEIEVWEPGAGQARIRHIAYGLNFIDDLRRETLLANTIA